MNDRFFHIPVLDPGRRRGFVAAEAAPTGTFIVWGGWHGR